MSYRRILEVRQTGPIELTLKGHDCNIEVTADPNLHGAWVEVYTEASSGPTIELIDGLRLQESSGRASLALPVAAGGGTTIINNSGIIVGNGTVVSQSFIGGRRSMIRTGGREIEVVDGRVFVDGVDIDAGDRPTKPAGDPPAVVHLRAGVPVRSRCDLTSHNGQLTTIGVAGVKLWTHNRDIRATGLTEDSQLKSHNGDITVGALPGHRPTVVAQSHNGVITALDDDLRLRPRTHNGDVRYPR